MLDASCKTKRAARHERQHVPLTGRISWAAVLPPYSWIAAYLTSPIEPTLPTTLFASTLASLAMEARKSPLSALRTWPDSLSLLTLSARAPAPEQRLWRRDRPGVPSAMRRAAHRARRRRRGKCQHLHRHPAVGLQQRQHGGRDGRCVVGDGLLSAERFGAQADPLGGAKSFRRKLQRRLGDVLRDIAVGKRQLRARIRRRKCVNPRRYGILADRRRRGDRDQWRPGRGVDAPRSSPTARTVDRRDRHGVAPGTACASPDTRSRPISDRDVLAAAQHPARRKYRPPVAVQEARRPRPATDSRNERPLSPAGRPGRR